MQVTTFPAFTKRKGVMFWENTAWMCSRDARNFDRLCEAGALAHSTHTRSCAVVTKSIGCKSNSLIERISEGLFRAVLCHSGKSDGSSFSTVAQMRFEQATRYVKNQKAGTRCCSVLSCEDINSYKFDYSGFRYG